MDLNIRIAGEAGQGVQSAGRLLVGAFSGMGLHVLSTMSYMSRIRGGLNWFDIRIGDRELFSGRDAADLLVALSDEAMDVLRGATADGGVVLYDGEKRQGAIGIDLAKAAAEVGGSKIMANTVAAGAVFAILGYDIEALSGHLKDLFEKKGAEVVAQNVACARRGAELAAASGARLRAPGPAGAPKRLLSGADAIGLSACEAGVKFAAAYPMTPGTATLNFLAANADTYGLVVEQAEDEIAAINMACGAAYAGAAALVPTSGGGFALMVEGLSLAGMMELPVVIVLAQRPGPATGLPTRTAQGDLRFAVHAGHGEFAKAVFAPGTVEQCGPLTRKALETAHAWQTPVILLTDQFLQDMEKNVEQPPAAGPIDRCIVADAGEAYVRYAVTDSGVSPRAIPGGEAFVVCDSDEHTDDGHITEDLVAHVRQQDKRMRKLDGMTAEAMAPELYGPPEAQTLLIAWGSTYGPAREAIDAINADGGSAALLHFAQVYPIHVKAAREAVGKRRRVVCVEGNQTGQFAAMLREAGVIGDVELLTRYDGLPFTSDTIVERL